MLTVSVTILLAVLLYVAWKKTRREIDNAIQITDPAEREHEDETVVVEEPAKDADVPAPKTKAKKPAAKAPKRAKNKAADK